GSAQIVLGGWSQDRRWGFDDDIRDHPSGYAHHGEADLVVGARRSIDDFTERGDLREVGRPGDDVDDALRTRTRRDSRAVADSNALEAAAIEMTEHLDGRLVAEDRRRVGSGGGERTEVVGDE